MSRRDDDLERRERATEERWDDPGGNTFEWSEPTRADAFGMIPRFDQEVTIAEVKGTYNNCDVYVAADTTWTSPLLGGCRLNLYALVGNSAHPIVTNVDPATLPDFVINGIQWRVYALSARGRVCDGFRATVTKGAALINPALNPIHAGQVTVYAWGHETAPGATIVVPPGVTIPVQIEGPDPLPVTLVGETVAVSETPATSWASVTGTAPDGSGGVTVATALAGSTPVQRYVDVTSDPSNAFGSILYVKSSASNLAAASGYALLPGATATIEVDDLAKVFVLGSVAGVVWRAARV